MDTLKRKAIIFGAVIALITILLIGVVIAVAGGNKFNSDVTIPDGQPTPTPTPTVVPTITPTATPTPTPIPTATPTPTPEPLTNTFLLSATLNGTLLTDPSVIIIPSGAYIGTVYNVVYTFTSTANQPITVQATVTAGQSVTGNEIIVWDATTTANGYAVSLPVNGAVATMTMTVTLGSVGGSIPLTFTASP
jgi:hypothetical protein